MTAIHLVEPGEHLGMIARKFGFANFSLLWEHPENAALKALRKEPTQLAPGDEVFIPDHVQLIFERLTDASHDFKVQIDKLELRLKLLGLDGKPLANAPVIARIEAPETDSASTTLESELTTDGEGNLTFEIATHVTSGSLEVEGVVIPLRIGGLDPVDTETGLRQRLRNLGYLPLEDASDPTQVSLAVEDFQSDNELPITGKAADIETKLVEVHGS
jgi:hypothetical protein